MTATVDSRFEGEVRAMLARRAADIPDLPAGSEPALPSGLRISVDPPPRDRRRAILLVAAVIVLLLGAVGVVAVTQGDGTRERTGPADAPTQPVGPFPDIPGLPQGIGAEDLLPLWTDPPGPDRYAKEDGGLDNAALAFGGYLADRLGPSASSSQRRSIEGFPDWSRIAFRVTGSSDGPESDEGIAYMWWSGEAWSVMAVLSTSVTLDELVVDSDRMVGSIYGDGPERVAALGSPSADLRLDRWPDSFRVVGENAGGDTGIVVDEALPAGPLTFLVAPLAVTSDPPPTFSEISFDPRDLATPGPTTVPTIPDRGISGDDQTVVGIPVDAPLGVAVASALPEGEELVAAQHRYDGVRLNIVELSSVVDGSGYDIMIFPDFTDEEYESEGTPTGWGRAWLGGLGGATSVTVESDDGVALNVWHEDPEGAASHDALLAIAETLVNDPAVIAVAQGADPAG